LEHIIDGTAQTMWHLAVAAMMTIAEIKVSEQWIVQEALEYNILIARCPSIVYASKTARPARGCSRVRRDVPWIVFDRVGEEFIVFSLATYEAQRNNHPC
jgi:hypothetical protein